MSAEMSFEPIRPDAEQFEAEELDADVEELCVDVREDNLVWVHGLGWDLLLSAEEAKLLAQALNEAAEDALQAVG